MPREPEPEPEPQPELELDSEKQPEPESEPEHKAQEPEPVARAPRRIVPMSASVDITAVTQRGAGARCSLCAQAVDENELRCGNCGTRVTRAGPAAAAKPKRASKPKDKTKRKGPKRRLKASRAETRARTQQQEQQRDGVAGSDARVVACFRAALRGGDADTATDADTDALAEGHALCLLDELSGRRAWPDTSASWAEMLEEVLGVTAADEPWVTVLAEGLADQLQASEAAGKDIASTIDAAAEHAGQDNPWAEVPAAGVVVGPDTKGLAILSDDGEWRWCVALELDTKRRDADENAFLLVRFTESMGLGKRQWVGRHNFRPEWTVACADDDEGQCAMCHRDMPLTFHHLIPREAADWVLSHGLSAEQMPSSAPGGQLTKDYLTKHGIMCCRPCHSSIHRNEDNRTLALEWNTLEKVLSHERIAKFVAWASGQPTVRKSDALAQLPRPK
jgi:hypothetical protein